MEFFDHTGSIYKIIDTRTPGPDTVCYVGSTMKTLKERMRNHNSKATATTDRDYNMPIYVHMREHGRENFKIKFIEAVEFNDKKDLLDRERHHMDTLVPICNRVRPVVTKKETDEKRKEWFADNKEHVTAYKKQYYEERKVEINEGRKEYSKARYQAKKDILNAQIKANHELKKNIQPCGCGGSVNIGNSTAVKRHNKTQKHWEYCAKARAKQAR